jgi:hypothetical protein
MWKAIWNWVRPYLLKIPVLQDWIISIGDSRAHARLRKEFVPRIEKARLAKNNVEVQNLYAEWSHNQQSIDEPHYVAASDKLVRKAHRLYVPVPRIPATYDAKSDDWQMSNITGDWALTVETYDRLQREVQTAQREESDEWRKKMTLLLALAGFILGLTSLWVKEKQPDPCPRNYYRDDTGACVFAAPGPIPIQAASSWDAARDKFIAVRRRTMSVIYWIGEYLDRILAFIAIVIAVIAMVDVRGLFKELERRDNDTENRIRREMLTHFASQATFAFAAQFIDFNEGEMGAEASISMLQAFHTQKLLAPNATAEELNELRKTTREQVGKEAVEWARLIVASGGGKMRDGWDLPPTAGKKS